MPGIPTMPQRPDQGNIDPSAMEVNINQEKARSRPLGAAATATERLAQRKRELDLAVRDNIISQNEYSRALGAAGLETAIQLEGRRLGMLGELAKVDDIVAQKQREINLARSQGVRVTNEESAAILQRTRLQAEYGKLPNKLQFERDQLGRSDVEATVAARLRSEGLPVNLDSAIAAEMRLNEQLKISKDLATDFAGGFARDLKNGVGAAEALGNAFGRLGDKLMDMALNNAISGLFGNLGKGVGATGGGKGGLLGGFLIPGILHDGGMAGSAPSSGRFIHQAYFDDAPRFHAGKSPFGPNEMPAIIDKREEVDYPANLARKYGGGGDSITVNVVDNRVFNDTTPQVIAVIQARDKAEWPRKKAEIVNEMKKRRAGDPNLYSPS